VFIGSHSGSDNADGIGNIFIGFHSGISTISTDINIFLGDSTGVWNTGDTNIFIGSYAGIVNEGTGNIFLGNFVGLEHTNGDNNTYIGHRAQNLASDFTNTTAIGANTIVTADNTMILGDTNVNVGIGLSGVTPAPQKTLEINARDINGNVVPDASGLRFRQLSSSSPFTTPAPSGVLSVNDEGDVIYVDAAVGTTLGGICGTFPQGLTDNWEIPLNGHNFIFSGNENGFATNNVRIGTPISTLLPCEPIAKLEIHQKSDYINSTGLFVQNDDLSLNGFTCGIFSYLPNTGENWPPKVAGWFQAEKTPNPYTAELLMQYAIFVPEDGGTVDIGYQYNTDTPDWLIDVNGSITSLGWTNPSDSIFKKDIVPLTHGLDVLRNISVVSYSYNGKGGFNTYGRYVGTIAEQLASVAPYAVDTSFIKLDSTDTELSPVLYVDQGSVIYTAINAIKQLDSSVTVLEQTIPPNKPILISPADSTTDIPLLDVTVIWHKSVRATSYAVFGRKEREFFKDPTQQATANRSVYEQEWDVIVNVTDTFFTCNLPDYCETYSWYIMALNDAGASTMSDIWSFTAMTPEPPEPPILSSPANASIDLPLANIFIWNRAERTGEYQLYISADTEGINLVNIIGVRDTFAVASVFDYNTTYYWWVVAYNCGGESIKSEIWSFTTVYDSAAPPNTSEPLASDSAFKNNVTPISDALSKTLQLNGIYFNWDLVNFPELQDTGRQTGLIAQQVEPVIPEVVSTDANGYLTVDYSRLVPVLIEAVKELKVQNDEQKAQNDEQQEQLDALQSIVNACCDTMSLKMLIDDQDNQGHTEQGAINEELKKTIHNIELSSNIVVLEQNRPNPFKENTVINYFIPEDVGFAQIIFYNNQGRVIKVVDIKEKGSGQLQVFAQNLTDGIYTYCIVFDGKVTETKKMVKAE